MIFKHTNFFLFRTSDVTNLSPYEPYLIRTLAYEQLLTNIFLYELYAYEFWSGKHMTTWEWDDL